MGLTMNYFPTGDADAPDSTHVELNAGCARVRYNPTLQQQNSISSQGLNADFIIQYDVDLRDLMGEVQVRSIFSFLACQIHMSVHVCHNIKCVFANSKGFFLPPLFCIFALS